MDIKPSLIELSHLIRMRSLVKISEANVVKPKQMGGFLSFLYGDNADHFAIFFTISFFLILCLFLYFRYKSRENKEFEKHKALIQFISSVDNELRKPIVATNNNRI